MSEKGIAVVTGANRGMGRQVASELAQEGYHVVMAMRDPRRNNDEGNEALKELTDAGLSAEIRKVDISSTEDCKALAKYLRDTHKGIDVLVNNAGILPESSDDETGRYPSNPWFIPPTSVMEIVNVNTLGPLRMIQALGPLMRDNGRIVNVSSGMGALTDMDTRVLGYRMSKTALNTITRVFSREFEKKNVKVNSVCPGWVRTDMGGDNARRSVEEGAASILWAARLGPDGPTGGFFRDGKELDW